MPRMYGTNVALRELRWEDLPEVRAWMTDPEAAFLGERFIRPFTWEQTELYLRDRLEGGAGGVYFAVAEPEKLAYLGEISLTGIDATARKANLTLVLKPECRDRGIGTEALRLMLAYAFDSLNLERVALRVHADNARAIRAYEKAGFVREGCLRNEAYKGGRYVDVLVMGILRGEFRRD